MYVFTTTLFEALTRQTESWVLDIGRDLGTEASMRTVPALPDSLIVTILSYLPDSAQAYSAKLVTKAAHAHFQHQCFISSSCAELPRWVLEQYYERAAVGRRTKLLAARAAQVGRSEQKDLNSKT